MYGIWEGACSLIIYSSIFVLYNMDRVLLCTPAVACNSRIASLHFVPFLNPSTFFAVSIQKDK